MKKYNRDEIGLASRFIRTPAEDSTIALLARYFAFALVEHHRFTEKFISFFLSVLPEERVLTLVQDSAHIAAQVLLLHGASLEITANDGTSPLDRAKAQGNLLLINMLIQYNAKNSE